MEENKSPSCGAAVAGRKPRAYVPPVQIVMDVMYELAALAGRLVPGPEELVATARRLKTREDVIQKQWALRCVPVLRTYARRDIAELVEIFVQRTGRYSVAGYDSKDVAAIFNLSPSNYGSFYRQDFERELQLIATAEDKTFYGRGKICEPLQEALMDVRRSLVLSSFNGELADVILSLMKEYGVVVTLLVDSLSAVDCAPALNRLIRKGAHVYLPPDESTLIQNNTWLLDDRLVVVGSFSSLGRNVESAAFLAVNLAEAQALKAAIMAECGRLQQDVLEVRGVSSMNRIPAKPEWRTRATKRMRTDNPVATEGGEAATQPSTATEN